VEPAPDVFQFPEMVHEPVVTVRVPDVPPVMVTVLKTAVEAFAVRMPPFPILKSDTSTELPKARSEVANAVVDEPSIIKSVVSHRIPRVAIVNVCGVPALELNVTLLNSASLRLIPAKVIVPPVIPSKRTVPVPASHTAPSVEAFVQVPLTVQFSLPKSMALNADEMFTLPVMVTFPLVDVRSPPLMARLATETVKVDLARVPPEMVSALVTTMFVANVAVPPETVSAENVLSVDSKIILAVVSNV